MSHRTREQQNSYNYNIRARYYQKKARLRDNIEATSCDPESLFGVDIDDPSV
jgi:hypothetical protein